MMHRHSIIIAAALWVTFTALGVGSSSMAQQNEDVRYRGKVNAPEFKVGLEWLNSDRPITMFELRGKVVLLDFWTFCCINCQHVLPDLKKLERKYPDELVVIGVHSGKFTAERVSDNIRQAILRHEIEHPVVNDERFEVFQEYGAKAWPTIVLVDPAGKIVGFKSGEGIFEPFDAAIAQVVREFEASGELDRSPLGFRRETREATELAFPGKVLADGPSNQLFIADTNHNRIIVSSLADGVVRAVAGSGASGLTDGDFANARFNHPQGMAFDGRYLYVADTENHAIRRLDLETHDVETIAGDGKQSFSKGAGGAGRDTPLNSPWALALHRKQLYVAMAGPHQIWLMDLANDEIGPYAGSGHEGIDDGPLATAALAQPSGMVLTDDYIYFADSETSAIRRLGLPPGEDVETIVGVGLFEYGDVDGEGGDVRLQHPLDLTYHDGVLYVVDTYNNKIKRIDPETKVSRTWLGSGHAGYRDGSDPLFDEPGGISYADGHLYVADTNNHRVRIVDLRTQAVTTLELVGLPSPSAHND